MDFITGLPKSERKTVIMVVVDRLTKYAHFFSLSHPFKESIVASTFIETIQKLHGVPKIIVSAKFFTTTNEAESAIFCFVLGMKEMTTNS
jgi:hypothetical protein